MTRRPPLPARSAPDVMVNGLKAMIASCMVGGRMCATCALARARLRELGELHATVPPEHRALSSGALGTPDRNHTCPACSGSGSMIADGLGLACCPRCAGCGERRADREPADHAFPDSSDRILRNRVAKKRAAGLLGSRGVR